ncbi:acetoacetate decarboxylase family protein [Streptomyces sp. Ag109_G2-15]|uniref:acetoacetate decarboxylase family protein n=1 Tax=Streptomyces sp. Ag109_G2-15 TaxID=1938850 RepID=UPI000BC70CE8|nr:acetoacetate decarboxylase family protein [Streptomyces sp. Ag109_G2-15]SOE06996.1 Acetoacetate decarboxylase (ADC) [Streptomyces sp. Ag109_G2-15]
MGADGHIRGRTAQDEQDTKELLRRCARDVVDVAEGIREVSTRTSTALFAPALTTSARRRPRTGLVAQWVLLRALTNKEGLGGSAITAPKGVGHVLGTAGEALGRESLAALVAVTSLRLRIAAVLFDHPEFERDPGMRRLLDAVTADRGPEAVRALRALFRDQGAQRALSGLAPLMAELLAIRALLDEDPKNDETGWALAAGRELSADPLRGISASHLKGMDHGEGAAEAVDLTDQERQTIATEGSLLGFLRNIEVLSTDGRILVQNVRGPDGVVRYVVQAPGMAPGRPRHDSPQDFVGAWRNLFMTDSPYTRSILLALADYGIPRGADLALIGHSEGGIAVMNLAQNEDFCRAYRVTHVIAVGSPVDNKKPADPRTWVATITNQHDIVPVLDGRGAGSGFNPHPNWYEVDYTGPTHEFPLCHMIREYIEHLRTVIPEAREDVDEALTPYRGPVVRTRAYQLKDRAHPPEGYPFLTVPTTSLATTTGPVDVPVRYYDSSAAHLCFAVDAAAARSLLPDVTWLVPSRLGRRALAVLSLYEHRCSTIGPYAEIALSVLVDDLWRPRPFDVATDLLRRVDLRRTGRYVLSLAVSSEESRVVAQEVWGQPAVRTAAEVDLMNRDVGVTAPELGLTVEGRLGPGLRCPEADWVLYGRRGDSTVRTLVRAHGRLRLHTGTGVRLRLDTAAAEPMAGQLRRLGIDAARPLFVLSCPQFMLHRSAGAVLPR